VDAKPIVFLDRDGILNFQAMNASSREQFSWIPGVLDGLRQITALGLDLVVLCEQFDTEGAKMDWAKLLELENWIVKKAEEAGVSFLDFWYCPHDPKQDLICFCRKPSARLLNLAAERYKVKIRNCWVMGVSSKEIRAADAAGMRSVTILRSGVKENLKTLTDMHFQNVDAFAVYLKGGLTSPDVGSRV
jgi:D-glycero-D-manno-heptose 1,7-bisphosphate phosphatase